MRSMLDYYDYPNDAFCYGFTNCPYKCYNGEGCDCDVPDGIDADYNCLVCHSPKRGGPGCNQCDIRPTWDTPNPTR